MTYRMYGAFVASLSALALMLAANDTLAGSGAAFRGGFTSAHSVSHRSIARAFRHHRRGHEGDACGDLAAAVDGRVIPGVSQARGAM